MKHFSWLIALLLVCSTQVSFADDCNRCDPCLNDCSFCDFDFCDVTYDAYVDYLYWELCRGGLDFDDANARITHGYQSGWRAGLNFNYDDWMLGLRYTSWSNKASRQGNSHDFDFKNLDIDMGYTIHFSCAPIDFTPFFGAKLVWIDEKLNIIEREDNLKMDYNGYGLRIGFNTRYNLCNWTFCDNSVPLAFVARASTGILRGKFDHNDQANECHIAPVHELYLGLDMKFCDLFCGNDANLQIGYEAQSFGFREIDSNDDTSLFGLQGLVVRFGMGF